MIKHTIQIEGGTKIVFSNAMDAFGVYDLLSKGQTITYTYRKDQHGNYDYSQDPEVSFDRTKVTMGTYHDE